MRLRFFQPDRLLRAHVAHIWIVESPDGWRPEDIKTIVPNGRMKLVFPYRGALLNAPVESGPKKTGSEEPRKHAVGPGDV